MLKIIFFLLLLSFFIKASDICLNEEWIKNIDKNKLYFKGYGHSPAWDFEILKGSKLLFDFEVEKDVLLTFNKDNNIIFFETKDKNIFGILTLQGNCKKNEKSYYSVQIVINNKLYNDDITNIYYLSKVHINNFIHKSLYSFCKTTGIKESEIRKLNPWINKKATNIPPNAEIIIPNPKKEENNESK